MDRGVLQSSPVQQMMAGNPNWWKINSMKPPTHQQAASPSLSTPSNFHPPYAPTPSSSSIPFPSWQYSHELPAESWSQLLMGGVVAEEDKGGMGHGQFQAKKLEKWEEQMLTDQDPNAHHVDTKKESSVNSSYVCGQGNEDFQAAKPAWSHQMVPPSSPKSGVSSFSSNMLDFSNSKTHVKLPPLDRSPECNSTTAAGGAVKKARVQPSTNQSTFKVRKEKLGDRITALHQLVSPFGKTDTASVLLEAIGYIRFLQNQIEALSLPYLGSGSSGNMRQQQQQQSVRAEKYCIFPEDPGQLLNENFLKRKATSEQDSQEELKKDLRSRGLCLVPVSCTLQVGSDNGADYWAPPALGDAGLR